MMHENHCALREISLTATHPLALVKEVLFSTQIITSNVGEKHVMVLQFGHQQFISTSSAVAHAAVPVLKVRYFWISCAENSATSNS